MLLSIRISLCAFLLSISTQASEKDDYFIYEAQSQPAEELQKAVQGITTQARLSVLDQKIIIYGTRAEREKVLRLFQDLDHKLQKFLVRLRIAKRGSSAFSGKEIEGRLGNSNLGVTKRIGEIDRGKRKSLDIGNGAFRFSAKADEQEASGDTEASILVLEGASGKIYTDSGLFATNVTVSVRPLGRVGARLSIREADYGSLGEQRILTEMNLPLGEWRTIGGTRSQNGSRSTGLLDGSRQSSAVSKDIQLRVDLQQEP